MFRLKVVFGNLSHAKYLMTSERRNLLNTIPVRSLSTKNKKSGSNQHEDGKYFINNIAHLPIITQREVFYHLNVLELENVQKRQDIDMKVVREQYLKLVLKYHPDTTSDSA